jgi:hypothetical protein
MESGGMLIHGSSLAGQVSRSPTRRRFLLTSGMAASGGFLPLGSARAAEAASAATRAAAFIVGDNLSLAALLYARGAKQDTIDGLLAKCNAFAKDLGVTVKPFPPRGKTDTATMADVIHYLIKGEGWAIGTALVNRYDKGHGLLFEVAVKSNLLMLLHQPGDDSGIGNIVKSRCEELKLPPQLWMPLVQSIAAKKPFDEVREAVFKMHKDVTDYLVKLAG